MFTQLAELRSPESLGDLGCFDDFHLSPPTRLPFAEGPSTAALESLGTKHAV